MIEKWADDACYLNYNDYRNRIHDNRRGQNPQKKAQQRKALVLDEQ